MKIKVLLVAVFSFSGILFSQENVVPFTANPVLIKQWKEKQETISTNKMMNPTAVTDTIQTLPFRDDFSDYMGYPDTNLWIDDNVYINRDLPVAPITLGVATFDGVSRTGLPYDTVLTVFGVSAKCDSFTSKYIKLDYPESDSVYFSFFYQAQGRGDKPEPNDSLILQFWNASTMQWKKVWGKQGFNGTQTPDSIFRLVMVQVDSVYLQDGFRFRFFNYATPCGSVDQWHIDYVYLNRLRSYTDTIFSDVAFVYSPTSLLKKYFAMPFNQYNASELNDTLTNFIRNNDTVLNNTFYTYSILNTFQNPIYAYPGSSGNIDPFIYSGYTTCSVPTTGCYDIYRTPLNTVIFQPTAVQNETYTVVHSLNPATDINISNDTVKRTVNLYNYYAYDDGTAESAYGLNQLLGQLAYKFTLNVADTIRAVDMCFNWIPDGLSVPPVNSVNDRQFRLRIWADNNGQPGAVIYTDSVTDPSYQYLYHNDWGMITNLFTRYKLADSNLVLSGTFYVGWIQFTSNLLSIGLDRNTNNNTSKLFYNTTGNWNQSVINGSVMIRPVFGNTVDLAGESEIFADENNILIYPNPANDIVNVNVTVNAEMKMYNSIGAEVGTYVLEIGENQIETTNLNNGIYFIHIVTEGNKSSVKKLIISR